MKQDDDRNGPTSPTKIHDDRNLQNNNDEENNNSGSHRSSMAEENNRSPQSITVNDDDDDENQNRAKRTLCKQPSNGIHVLKTDSSATANNGPPPPFSDDTTTRDKNQNQLEDITFDPKGSYYMANACCELIHYRTAAILIGVIEVLLLVTWAVMIGLYYKHGWFGGTAFGSVASKISIGIQTPIAAAFLAIIVLMILGILLERPYLLWPHMVVQIGGISLGIGFTVLAVIAMCAGTSLAEFIFSGIFGQDKLPLVEQTLGPIWPFCLAVVFDFGAALGIWFYIVVKGCYEYLMDKIFFETHFNDVLRSNLGLKGKGNDNNNHADNNPKLDGAKMVAKTVLSLFGNIQ